MLEPKAKIFILRSPHKSKPARARGGCRYAAREPPSNRFPPAGGALWHRPKDGAVPRPFPVHCEPWHSPGPGEKAPPRHATENTPAGFRRPALQKHEWWECRPAHSRIDGGEYAA